VTLAVFIYLFLFITPQSLARYQTPFDGTFLTLFFVSRARKKIRTNDRIKAEKEAKIKAAEDEVRRKAQEEAKRTADEEARVKAEQVSITLHTVAQNFEKHAKHCPAELWLVDEC
jgi:hypothetical protein